MAEMSDTSTSDIAITDTYALALGVLASTPASLFMVACAGGMDAA